MFTSSFTVNEIQPPKMGKIKIIRHLKNHLLMVLHHCWYAAMDSVEPVMEEPPNQDHSEDANDLYYFQGNLHTSHA